jgi:hypothetical protein
LILLVCNGYEKATKKLIKNEKKNMKEKSEGSKMADYFSHQIENQYTEDGSEFCCQQHDRLAVDSGKNIAATVKYSESKKSNFDRARTLHDPDSESGDMNSPRGNCPNEDSIGSLRERRRGSANVRLQTPITQTKSKLPGGTTEAGFDKITENDSE